MARKRKKTKIKQNTGWLITFSDLVTLVLTFFVLLLTMSSVERSTLSHISTYFGSHSQEKLAAGKIPERIIEIVKILRDPTNAFLKQERMKDLLFPQEILPPEITKGDLHENMRILEHPEGVVIVLTEGIVFEEGSATLSPVGKALLQELTPVILTVDSDVNISGHTDPVEITGAASYELGANRSLAVLEQFLLGEIKPSRFSVSSYGPDKPIAPNTTIQGRAQNRRIEVLLKTTKWVGKYS